MWNDINKIILITDMDGTILSDELKINKREIDSVNEFRRLGGSFTVSTGRCYQMMKRYAKWLSLDDCAVLYNGCAVFDYKNQEFLWKQCLDHDAFDFIKECSEKFPYTAVELLGGKEIYVIRMNSLGIRHLVREEVKYENTDFASLEGRELIKCLFALPNEHMAEFSEFAFKNRPDTIECVQSSDNYFEFLPKGISKAAGNKKLLELTDRSDYKVVAIGDFYNDLEMIKAADFGVTVATAPDAVKEHADLVVSSCEDGAVTDLIKYIIKRTNE